MGWVLGLLGLAVTGTLLPLTLVRLQPAALPVRVWTATAVFTAFLFHLVALSLLPNMLSLMVRTRLAGSESAAFPTASFSRAGCRRKQRCCIDFGVNTLPASP